MPAATAAPRTAEPAPRLAAAPVRPLGGGLRVFLFYSSTILLTGVVSLLFADLLWRSGWSRSSTVLLVVFVMLFQLIAVGCMHGVFGFVARVLGDPRRLSRTRDYASAKIEGVSVAIVMPVYNEDAERVCEGLRATYASVERTGHLQQFDFFLLSDSTDPDKWVDEERRWCELLGDLDALGRIYYRRRTHNEGKKSGNIRDFLSTWGKRYRYFIVLDADSVMRGDTLVDLVKLMETHPDIGLIQTLPAVANAESLFGRIQQFANRLYAPVFIAGLNFWARAFGNYWGHNAIIRTEPFMQSCDLPRLPGRKPFGGQILSHDFVEAALLLRDNWQVWLAYDLEGSYEEAPQDMLENAERDRRWCQGNMQHGLVFFAQGLRGISRMHLLLGVFGYLASPLWLCFLLEFHWALWSKKRGQLSDITIGAFNPFIKLSGPAHAFLIFCICLFVLFLPKVLALIDLALDGPRRRSFGGLRKAAVSALAETLFSTLHAPLQMLWHSRFVVMSFFGRGVQWSAQKRTADGIAWSDAFRVLSFEMLIGLVWGWIVWQIDQPAFWWFVPVLAGMLLSVPVSVLTSRSDLGARARRLGLFLVPEETAPPAELDTLRVRMALMDKSGPHALAPADAGLLEAVLDPYVNAIHVSLLREKKLNPVYAEELAKLGVGRPEVRPLAETLLARGPEALKPAEKMLVLSDADVMAWLHRQAWVQPSGTLAAPWQKAIRQYAR